MRVATAARRGNRHRSLSARTPPGRQIRTRVGVTECLPCKIPPHAADRIKSDLKRLTSHPAMARNRLSERGVNAHQAPPARNLCNFDNYFFWKIAICTRNIVERISV